MNLFVKRFTSVLAGSALLVPVGAGVASADEVVRRSYGPDRIATAVQASQDYRSAASDVLLTTATTFPDALSAGALANRLDAPLLLTSTHALPQPVLAELQRLAAARVWILGGEGAVSEGVAGELRAAGFDVRRLAGDSRYATGQAIAEAAGPSATGEVVVALGEHADADRAWPDAVASGNLAATPDAIPTVLTRPDELPPESIDALTYLQARKVFLLGGESAIGPAVEAQLLDLGYEVERVAGGSRYATSLQLAAEALDRFHGETQAAVFASGQNFPDALSAGSLAASLGAPLVLVPSDALPGEIDAWIREREARLTTGALVGGPAAANDYVAQQIDAALQGEPEPAPPAEASAAEEAPADDGETVTGTFQGWASWYGPGFAGRPTASGETFNPNDLTAAHRSLPFQTRLRVTNTANGAQVIVRINDRGPFHRSRVLDVSSAAADILGMKHDGTAYVHIEILAG